MTNEHEHENEYGEELNRSININRLIAQLNRNATVVEKKSIRLFHVTVNFLSSTLSIRKVCCWMWEIMFCQEMNRHNKKTESHSKLWLRALSE